jgi:hypothetical protein
MKFGPLELVYFGAEEGAFSKVMEDEQASETGQINVDQFEREVILSVFPRSSIHTGAKRDATAGIAKPFTRWKDGRTIQVQINFPKPDKPSELRIYVPATDDFSPPAGDIWFVFRRSGQLFIGNMPESDWRCIGRLDEEDARYVDDVHSGPGLASPAGSVVTAVRFPRNRLHAELAFRRAGYKCEFEPSTSLFEARSTGLPYLEPHHLIHRSLQPAFSLDLDHPDNIYALSPHHHRRIHSGTVVDAVEIIDRLLGRRRQVLDRFSVSRGQVLGFYNCLDIN